MTKTMQEISRNMQTINVSVAQMNQSTAQMADSVNRMQYATSNMDKTFTTPMNAVNSFMPWGSAPVQYPQPNNNPYLQR
jgi:methyl-accepting chemotaxis protein